MQPTGEIPVPRPGTSFKNGPPPPEPGAYVDPVVRVNLGGSVVVQTGDAKTATNPDPPKPGP
jgi:hypothetical protein